MSMKTTIGRLRQLIREAGLDSDMRNMAGSMMDFGADNGHRDRESSVVNGLPGLGDEAEAKQAEEDEDKEDGTQEKSQPGARVSDRAGGPGRLPYIRGNRG